MKLLNIKSLSIQQISVPIQFNHDLCWTMFNIFGKQFSKQINVQ